MRFFTRNKTYLDHASGAPIHKEVSSLMSNLFKDEIYNPAASHSGGINASNILENSRLRIAENINAHKDEIIFTGSCTESIALAIMGTVMEARKSISVPHVITSTIEHSAVIETCKLLESRGLAEITYLGPDDVYGRINVDSIKNNVKDTTVLVSIHMVNGEIGTIQDINSYIQALNKLKEEKYKLKSIRFTNDSYYPYLHLDAAQAYAHLDLSSYVRKGVDMISFNSTKIGGPAGIAALFKRRGAIIEKIYAGGDQEFGFRPGTSSVQLSSAFALASSITKKNIDNCEKRYKELKEFLLIELLKFKPEDGLFFIENSSKYCVPSIINISFPYFSGQQMAIELDARDVMVSSKSACKSDTVGESIVINEIRKKDETKAYNNYGSIRISFGPNTKKKDIIKLTKALFDIARVYKGVLY